MNFIDKEQGESQQHEQAESKSFEKKEDRGLVKDAADKRALRKKAMGRVMGAM